LIGTCLVIFLCLASKICAASTYYVSPTGDDDNPGTEALPFATVQKGLQVATNGDTIFIFNGTYDLQLLTTSITNNITLVGESKENTIITNGRRLIFRTGFTARNLTFKDFDKASYDYAVFALYAPLGSEISGVYLENLIIENVPNFVFTLDSAG